jgi:type IV fimbrial biogenesis protein FimT
MTCVDDDEWSTGWIVFVDDGANDQEFDAGERIVQTTSGQSGIASLGSSGGVTFLQFLPNGFMAAGSTPGATTGQAVFTVTPKGATPSTEVNRITVSRVGRTSIAKGTP